jgi:hypothetical protein
VFLVAMSFPASSPVAAVAAGPFEGFKNWTAGAASIATLLAIGFGGVWAYYKFIRSRTFRPRLSVEILGQWRDADGREGREVADGRAYPGRLGLRLRRPKAYVFHVRLRVTNIGAAKVTLKQLGTGLTISFPREQQPLSPYYFGWESVSVHKDEKQVGALPILTEHEWIEPAETVSDDLLLDLDRSPTLAMLEVTLMWSRSRRKRFSCRDIEVFKRQIIPPDSVMVDNA